MSDLTPRQIVAELDRDIVGQAEAKRAVAIALRDRWRRKQLADDLRAQVMPKNAKALFDIIIKELMAVFNGELNEEDITMAKQYALGRYQRSGQTVGGTASGYSNRYFFDDVVDDYYKVPERIRAVSRNRIISITESLFNDQVWGIGVLGNAGDKFVEDLHKQIKVLWKK